MPAKIFAFSGEDQTVEQIFSTPSKRLQIRNSGVQPVEMFLIEVPPDYGVNSYTMESGDPPTRFPVITDRIKFKFKKFSRVEMVEVY